MKNDDKPYLSIGFAMYSIEMVAESLSASNNFHDSEKCQTAAHWLHESVFSVSEHRMDSSEHKAEDKNRIVSICTRGLDEK